MRPAFLLALAVALASCDACDDEETRQRKSESREGKPLSSAAHTTQLDPVYPEVTGDVPPLVKRLCEALHGLPRRKRAECCKTTPGVMITSECERNLTGALSAGAVKLAESSVEACENSMAEMSATCDWIGPWQPPMPASCLGIIGGTKSKDDRCRSNLECEDGMRCIGLGPTDLGTCAPPPALGSICGVAVDTLAVFTRQDDLEVKHPACIDGYCDRTRCVPYVPDGEVCVSSVQCKGSKCFAGRCSFEGCSGGDCAPGQRCIAGECKEPKSIGEQCTDDRECKSACVSGSCQARCLSPAILRGLIKTTTTSHQP